MISDKYKLETLLKRKRGVPFEKLEEQMQIYSFELKLFIINYVIEKMSEFNFQTPRKNNIHLKKVFLYLNKEDDNLTREQKEELIKRLMELKNTVDILLGNAIIKTENADLNEAMLVELLNDVQYTILNLECDYDKNKMFAKLKGMGNELYDLLEYVIFNNNDISIFKLLVNVDIFLNADRNKEIVLKVLDKYFNTFYNGNDYDQLYYQAVLEEFLLSGKKYLTDDDVVSILNSLTRFSKKEQIVLENEDNLLRLIKDLENGNLKKKGFTNF